jgi:hypothetical protein
MNNCEHKNLKYFKETDKIICLDCGEDFYRNFNYQAPPSIPYIPITPAPEYPVYPIVTWNKVLE